MLISAFIGRGTTHEVFEQCLEEHVIFISEHILREFKTILAEKLSFRTVNVDKYVDFLENHCEFVEPEPFE